jgi:hypothetical protein
MVRQVVSFHWVFFVDGHEGGRILGGLAQECGGCGCVGYVWWSRRPRWNLHGYGELHVEHFGVDVSFVQEHGEFHPNNGREPQYGISREALAECELDFHLFAVVEERGVVCDRCVDCDALFVVVNSSYVECFKPFLPEVGVSCH